jgi:hypothetical protein
MPGETSAVTRRGGTSAAGDKYNFAGRAKGEKPGSSANCKEIEVSMINLLAAMKRDA